MVTFHTNHGDIVIKTFDDKAPETVKNFLDYCREGFYNNTIFHRVINGFMIQGGDPEGTGMGGAKENIKGEFAQNGVKNDLKHTRGVISMARSMLTEISKNTWKKINTISSAENSPVSLPIRKN